jgi:predicted nucleic acid-binding protein
MVLGELYYGNASVFEAIEEMPGLIICPVSAEIIKRAGVLRHDYKLRLADSIHLATALCGGATEFYTNDMQLIQLGHVDQLAIRPL